ncbi:MAG: hypothetical protein EOP04_02000 [Proteobacteria bacterium]|nr:MAG: hypothetical protein EOP04_02000 [Pseudomonadota bacterium]
MDCINDRSSGVSSLIAVLSFADIPDVATGIEIRKLRILKNTLLLSNQETKALINLINAFYLVQSQIVLGVQAAS